MSYTQQFKKWADNNEPLTMEEQINLMENGNIADSDKILLLTKHNARLFTKVVNRWKNSFDDLDDAYSLAVIAIHKAFKKWDYTQYIFGSHASLYISASLHYKWKKYQSDAIDYHETPEVGYIDEWDDIADILELHLNSDEWEFIYNIYYKCETIGKAGKDLYNIDSSKASKIHREILAKLKQIIN